MESANNPEQGTGNESNDSNVSSFAQLLDSENGTTENVISKDEEIDEVSTASEDEAHDDVESDHDQVEETEAEAETEDATDEAVAPFEIPDDATIEINGNKVTGKELKNGFLLQADYTKKTQELAQEKRKYVENRVDLGTLEQDYANNLQKIQQVLFAAVPDLNEPDWEDLLENDPATYLKEQARWEKIKGAIAASNAEIERVKKAQAEHDAIVRYNAQQNARKQLVEHVPEFRDPVQAKANLALVESFLRDECYFAQEEVDGIQDARLIVLALEAKRWRDTQKQVPKAVKRIEEKPALTMPGAVAQRKSSNRTAFDDKVREAQRTGNSRNLFLHLLDNS